MKKAIHEWAFNFFTKRITIKVAKLPNEAKIEFLANKLMNEMIAQGNDITGLKEGSDSEYMSLFAHQGERLRISSNTCDELVLKRQMKL